MSNDRALGDRSNRDRQQEYSRVKNASILGASVGGVTLVVKACVDLGSIAVLARLLTPGDFGVVAMASTLLNLLRIVGDWGLVMAATQQQSLKDEQLSKLFWINLVVGICLALLSVASAPILVSVF